MPLPDLKGSARVILIAVLGLCTPEIFFVHAAQTEKCKTLLGDLGKLKQQYKWQLTNLDKLKAEFSQIERTLTENPDSTEAAEKRITVISEIDTLSRRIKHLQLRIEKKQTLAQATCKKQEGSTDQSDN